MYAHRCVLFVYGPCADVTPLCGGSGNGSRQEGIQSDKREYKAEKLVNGNVRLEPQGPKKTVRYYEILSRTPLTAKQCQDSIRLGKARQVSRPVRKYRHRKNVTLDGWDGVNPADAEQTEYDLNYEDPDLYDFIAD